jgi:hypothetical protein
LNRTDISWTADSIQHSPKQISAMDLPTVAASAGVNRVGAEREP